MAEVLERLGFHAKHTAISEPSQHDQCIVGTSAQRLRARQHEHQFGVVWLAGLNGPPGKRMKGLEVAALGGVQRQLPAILPTRARRFCLRSKQRAQDQQDRQHSENYTRGLAALA